MEERRSIETLKSLLLSLEKEWPEVKEFRDWPRLFSLVIEAPADTEFTREVAEASLKLLAALASIQGKDPRSIDWGSLTLSAAPGIGALCDRLLRGGITPPGGPCEKIKRTIMEVTGPAPRERPL